MNADSAVGRRVHAGEWRAVALSFLYFFCVLSAYYVVRPVRDQLSAAVGSPQLFWFYAAVFVATLAVILSGDPHATVIGGMPWVAVALIVSRGLAYGALGPARESLFAHVPHVPHVPRSLRYKGKNAVDTAVWRFGDMSVALAMNGLRAVGTVAVGFAALNAVAATTSGVLGWRLARRIEREQPPSATLPAASVT